MLQTSVNRDDSSSWAWDHPLDLMEVYLSVTKLIEELNLEI
jgi:hypothetical protein